MRGSGTEFLTDDAAAGALEQEPTVPRGGEPAVGDPDDLAEGPVPYVLPDPPDQCRVRGISRPAPDPDRDPVTGDCQADHDLRQVIPAVLGLAVRPEPRGL